MYKTAWGVDEEPMEGVWLGGHASTDGGVYGRECDQTAGVRKNDSTYGHGGLLGCKDG